MAFSFCDRVRCRTGRSIDGTGKDNLYRPLAMPLPLKLFCSTCSGVVVSGFSFFPLVLPAPMVVRQLRGQPAAYSRFIGITHQINGSIHNNGHSVLEIVVFHRILFASYPEQKRLSLSNGTAFLPEKKYQRTTQQLKH